MYMRGADFQQKIELMQAQLIRSAVKITRNKQDAEDAVQEAFLKAWKHLEGFEGRADFKTWLTKIVINESLMFVRAPREKRAAKNLSLNDENQYGSEFVNNIPSKDLSALDALLVSEKEIQMKEIFASVPVIYREAIQLAYHEDRSENEIVQSLGISKPAVKARLHRGRKFLESKLRNVDSRTNKTVVPTVGGQNAGQPVNKKAPTAVRERNADKESVVTKFVKAKKIGFTTSTVNRAFADLEPDQLDIVTFQRCGMPFDKIAGIMQMTFQQVSNELSNISSLLAERGFSPDDVQSLMAPQRIVDMSGKLRKKLKPPNERYLAAAMGLN